MDTTHIISREFGFSRLERYGVDDDPYAPEEMEGRKRKITRKLRIDFSNPQPL